MNKLFCSCCWHCPKMRRYFSSSSYLYNVFHESDMPPLPTHTNTPYVSSVFPLDDHIPQKTKVLICGGGIVGTSLAYHLAKRKWGPDTLLIEQGMLGGPTSWRGSGFLGGVKLGKSEMEIIRSSLTLVKELHSMNFDVGWKECGSLHIARTQDRFVHFLRIKSIAEARGTECFILKPREISERWNLLNVDDMKGALWVPSDGVCDPYKLSITLLQLAREAGVKIVENCTLSRLIVQNDRVRAAKTTKGLVDCDIFVNAGGTWARKIGQMSEPFVKVPIHTAENYFLYTEPLEGVDVKLPAIRDPDGFVYMREYYGGILAGSFLKNAKAAFETGDLPEKWHQRELAPNYDHFHGALKEIIHRVPVLESAVLNQLHNSADGFSPDSRWIIGQVPEFRNYYVAAGMKSGSNAAVGVSKMLTEWIIKDHPPIDVYELDILRFLPAQNNRKFLQDRVTEVQGVHYKLSYPFPDFTTGRCIRMSPIFPKLKEAGAVFGQVMAYERPSYFLSENQLLAEKKANEETDNAEATFRMARGDTFGKPAWFHNMAEEYKACRETVGLLDYSSFAKFDVFSRGNEVVEALQYLCSNDVDVPIGGICHSGMQNKYGGYENDCSLARIAPNHYMMIVPSIQQTRCLTWLKKNLPSDDSVVVSDVTSMYTAICLMGPMARNVLADVSDTDMSPKSFPFFSFKMIDIGLVNGIRAMNLTHTGEIGWVLYIPNMFALHVYDNLIEAGKKYGLTHVGYYAMRSLRLEKFYAFWGQDLDSTTTPLECGRVFRTKLDKDIDFMGRSALEKQKKEGVKRLYIHLTLEDHDLEVDNWPLGGEPIYRNGVFQGVTTTTGYGFTLQKSVCLGFIRNVDSNNVQQIVTPEYVLKGQYEVEIAGMRYYAKVSLRSPSLPSKYSQKNSYVATQS